MENCIPINNLKDQVWYKGYCAGERGPEEMMWDSERGEFQYWRYKFGEWFIDFMQHEDDPRRYRNVEGFIPLQPLKEK